MVMFIFIVIEFYCLPETAHGGLLGLASGSGLGGGALAHYGLGSGYRAGLVLAGQRLGRLSGKELELALLGHEASVTETLDGL